MLEAFIHGKLSTEQENMEDMLTSCVFGGFKFIPPSAGVLPFLAQAIHWRGGPSVLSQLDSLEEPMVSDIEYSFWPRLENPGCHPCEPDVLLKVKPTRQLILVEAKLHSGKSSEADDGRLPYDQLAREWDNLLHEAHDLEPILVFLTADRNLPRESIRDSVAEFQRKRKGKLEPNIYWLSWQHLNQLGSTDSRGVLDSLRKLLGRLDLLAFSGWKEVYEAPRYSFATSPLELHWLNYEREVKFDWTFN